jgi:N-acetylglucosamine kinase-like BadF-type ATPase
MILIVESGSTKSDWVLVENGAPTKRFKTMGFNPFFHNEQVISNAINDNQELSDISNNVLHVFFYGAGCSSDEMNAIVSRGLKRVFMNAEVSVDHDLLACALATYEGKPSIACILGTGSNSCYYDGQKLTESVPALGYILGDEGSGSFYGKKLLTDFLYNKLPEDMNQDLLNSFKIDKEIIFENVYRKPHANVYLASFMKFISGYKHTEYVDSMVKDGMKKFIENHVCCYDNCKEVKVHFIGSLSFIFQDQLNYAADKMGINVGLVIKNPADNLVSYHINNLYN